ncbi:hypothetical protein AVEN_211206-1 [Araneus ventricosus]|uniref:Uncharacterized protein n=1 Tax=Araneus ventricosus TaxID=182803 RepID=A0A4Y2FQZ3_ARAVE|nr:hypothetical protein AVEN_268354-1 [Araneus ventricosus]GBM43447.1 hypothetical protein AVEN_211206-1 [Araneus ventricosus]
MNVTKQTVDATVEMCVWYQSVHVGHELETGKLRLTKAEKENLAADLNLGIPMSKILDKTRHDFSSTNRFNLTTRKDLRNICRDFQLREESVYDANDSTSVDIIVDVTVEICVWYQSVHVEHELETGKLRLTKAEKENLAADLNLGIPMSKILDKTRHDFSPTNRFNLTTRKDLRNICRDFQLREKSVYDTNDSTSVDKFVQKLMNESDDPVQICK